ncbi:MAG TPA: cyanophycin synthetase, partial [Gemmatimonadaceae bacterium]|nr:cyanophycin synthetase [Gemmatimonadaceae bacterium]
KAGIFKPGRAAVIGECEPRIRDLLADHARRAGASEVRIASEEIRFGRIEVADGGTTCHFTWKRRDAELTTPLAGRHQAANLAFALVMLDAAGERFRVGIDDAASDLRRVRIPGRFQHIGRFIFDVAHNPAGSDVLAQTIRTVAPDRPVTVLLCVLRDKDWRAMLHALAPVANRFVLTMAPTAPASRAWDLREALRFAQGIGVRADAIEDFDAALTAAQENAGTVVVTGSFHTVGDAMERLQVSPLAWPA